MTNELSIKLKRIHDMIELQNLRRGGLNKFTNPQLNLE